MRNMHRNVSTLQGHLSVGNAVSKIFDTWLAKPGNTDCCLQAIGSDRHSGPEESELTALRMELARFFTAKGRYVSDADSGPIDGPDVQSPICGRLLHAWASSAGDPAANVAKWCWEGAPLGIKTEYSEISEILPTCKASDVKDPESLVTDYTSFANYSGIEDDPDIINSVRGYVKAGYLAEFDSFA